MNPDISILILAAGASTRMKTPKQLLPWEGKTVVEQVLATAMGSKANDVYLVLGANKEEILDILTSIQVEVIVNDDWESGMGSSLSLGIKEILDKKKPDGILLMLSDQPLIDINYLNKMIDTFSRSKMDIVGTAYPNKTGVPAIFGSSIFTDLMKLKGDEGAWPVISRYKDNLIALDAGPKVLDLDTPEDYRNIYKSDTDTLKSP